MREERLEVSVTFDERHGYIASAPELRQPNEPVTDVQRPLKSFIRALVASLPLLQTSLRRQIR